jgi:hypothetical protein
MGDQTDRKVAIIAIHGIGPQQRYVMQDNVAEQLAKHLEKRVGGTWTRSVFYPKVNQQRDAAQSYASALRVAQQDGQAGPSFDVYEAYWSPIDKGKTNVRTVFGWLLKTLFVPLSTTARMPATFWKLVYDGAYTAIAMILTLGLFVGAVWLTVTGYVILAPGRVEPVKMPSFVSAMWTAATDPMQIFKGFKPQYVFAIVLAFIAMYLLLQFAIAAWHWWTEPPDRDALHHIRERAYTWWRIVSAVALVVLAIVFGYFAVRLMDAGPHVLWALAAVVIGASALRAALALANDFFVNRIGDVQIYTSRDWNSDLHALREKITETVQQTIQQVLDSRESDRDDTPKYERVYILAHSLGSTIAMDALIRLHQLQEGGTISEDLWQRIRGFITFGTALEKTKFFFDLARPSLSQSYDQWRGKVYGHLFTKDQKALTSATHQIYWTNYWYFDDLVANEIRTYRDGSVSEEERIAGDPAEICVNVQLRSPAKPWVHSAYLTDNAFWAGSIAGSRPSLLDILLAKDERPRTVRRQLTLAEVIALSDGSWP